MVMEARDEKSSCTRTAVSDEGEVLNGMMILKENRVF
jgi:hypothetical protein